MEEKFEVSKADFELLERWKKIAQDDKKHQRELSISHNQRKMRTIQREVVFKKDQVASGISLEKDERYVSGLKPLWFLENEIDEMNAILDQCLLNINATKEEMKND